MAVFEGQTSTLWSGHYAGSKWEAAHKEVFWIYHAFGIAIFAHLTCG